MDDNNATKHNNLMKAGLFNSNQERVKDPLFLEHPKFFNPYDIFQVRYEMLRSHLFEKDNIVHICERFGISRQSFYTLKEKFNVEGTAGLLPHRPGPKGPSKLKIEVLEFIQEFWERKEYISAIQIKAQVQDRFGVSLHKRTIEKLFKQLKVKKNSKIG